MDGKSANTATNMIQAVKALASENDTTLDMFGFDDSAIKEAEEMAKIAAKKQREIQDRLNAITGAAKRPEIARAEGIDVKDPAAVQRRADELKKAKAEWDNWSTNPSLIGQIRAARGTPAPAFELTSESESERQAREDKEAAEREGKERKEIADREVDMFALTPSPAPEQETPPTEDLFAAKEPVKAEEPAKKAAKPAEPEVKKETEEEKTNRENAESHAKDLGGTIVWRRGENALIRGYSLLTGDPVYAVTFGERRATRDIESFTGTQISPELKQELIEVKQKLEQEAEEKHKNEPFIKFVDGVAVSESISPEIEGIIREWKNLLKLDVPIYVGTIQDARRDKDKYTGPHRRIGSGTLDAGEDGSTRMMADGSHYILLRQSTSPTLMLEVLAHELGHIHQKVVYENASADDKKALKDAHQKWVESQKGKTAKELIDSLRGRATQRRPKPSATQKAEDLTPYWRSFSEWYADQTSRWAMSDKVPVTAVEKFFKRLGNQLRRFFQQLKARKYLPDETFVQYINRVTERPPAITITPNEDDIEFYMATDTDAASSMSANAGQAGWTERRIKRLINEFGYIDGRTYGIAAFVNPADFVRATTPNQKAVEYIREEAGPLDLTQLSEETQTPFLDIDMEKGAIIGHEGRHRMQAMADAGIARAAVVIWARDRYGSKQPAQYDPVDAMTVSGQRFAGGRGQYLSLSNLVPIEYRQEKRLLDEFGDLSSTILYNIDSTGIDAGLKSSRDEQIKQYATLRAALARVPKQVAEGKASIDMQRNTTELIQMVRDLQTEIKITKPRLDSAEQFLSKALKEYDAGNISKDVLDVINTAYQKYPELLEGLLLRVRAAPER
jgi:hypothetical protein